MMALPIDQEARASRYLDAMHTLEDLLSCRAVGLDVSAEGLAQLLAIMNAEAHKVVWRGVAGERVPGLRCANDEDDPDG